MGKGWSLNEVEFLCATYGLFPAEELASRMGRPLRGLYCKAFTLGLKGFKRPCIPPKQCCAEGCGRFDKEPGGGNGMCSLHRQREYKKDPGVRKRYNESAGKHRGTLKGRFSTARGEAKRRKIEFSLSFQDYVSIWTRFEGKCAYHGDKIQHNGVCLDRLDSSSGYMLDNCVLCCVWCNRLKGEYLTPEETKLVVQLLQELRGQIDLWGDKRSHKALKGEKTGWSCSNSNFRVVPRPLAQLCMF